MENNKGILLETGTNELEIVEFGIGQNHFGINVIKVREIINPVPVTIAPNSHPHVEGIIELRGRGFPVVDVANAIGFPASIHQKRINLLSQNLISKKSFFMYIVFRKFIVFLGNKLRSLLRCTKEQKAK